MMNRKFFLKKEGDSIEDICPKKEEEEEKEFKTSNH